MTALPRKPRNGCAHDPVKLCPACKRRRNTQAAQAKRDRELTAKMETSTRCLKGRGGGVCNGRLRIDVDHMSGCVAVTCERCERKARGLCQDCPARITGRSLRCDRCKRLAQARQIRESKVRHRDERRDRERERYRALPDDVKAERLKYRAAWRQSNPDKVRAQKRRAALRQSPRVTTYQRRYRKTYHDYLRQREQARWAAIKAVFVPPKCRDCKRRVIWEANWQGRPPLTCDRCALPHQLKVRRAARRRQRSRVKAIEAALLATFGTRPKPMRVPRGVTMVGANDHHCITCPTVLTGRSKKCAACKTRDRDAAAALIATRQGRGRRTDRERAA